jgi:hypothetical protein
MANIRGTTGPLPSTGARTADDVIQSFSAIGLPVTDDAAVVEKKIADQYPRRQREKNSPDRDAAHRATLWMRDANDLRNNRPTLLELVYAKFLRQADTSLQGALAAGLQTLTSALVESLRSILRDDCRADDDLATKFLDRYLAERGLDHGSEIVKPELVQDFAAVDSGGRISLSWSLPLQKCDRVEIVRQSESNLKDRKTYAATGASFEDVAMKSGVWYVYRAYSIHQDVKSTGFVEARAVAAGNVSNVQPVCEDGRVALTWDSAGPAAVGVMIFRRAGSGATDIVKKDGALEPRGNTALVYRGGGTSFTDEQIAEGATYVYRIVADFGDGRFASGIDTQITVPKSPTAPSDLTAVYERAGGEDVVALQWAPVAGAADVRYVVARRRGETAPAKPDRETRIEETTQTRCLDRQVAPGDRYSYAVFSRAGGLHSRTPATAPPVDILSEVSRLSATAADGAIELEWVTPDNAVDVVVKRSLTPPRGHDDTSIRVRLSGKDHARDEGLQNDRQYHYLLCAVYRPSGSAEVVSRGVRIQAVPVRSPEPPEGFAAVAQGREVRCTWTPPAVGQAVVLRSEKPHGLAVASRLPADDLNRLGERVPVSGAEALDTTPDIRKPFYSVFSVAGPHSIAGGTAACVVCPDVADLAPQAIRDGVILRWHWPDGCTAVRIVRRVDDWPRGPDDEEGFAVACTRVEFDAAGGCYVDRIQQNSGRFHYVVYALASGAPGQFFSAGTSAACRAIVQWDSSWTTMRYCVLPGEKRRSAAPEMRLEWSVEEIAPGFSGFVLLANQDRVPSSLEDGVELFRWTPTPGERPGTHRAVVSLAPIKQRHWPRLFAKAMVVVPAQRFTTQILHPNVCVPISDAGEVQLRLSRPPRVYVKGVPRKVICPTCFTEFPVRDMMFRSFKPGGPVLQGRYTVLDRLRGRPPRPPIHENERLTDKVCPSESCRKPLPFTSGAQSSLVIGMIGAKYSGKSHYIGSLIERLSTQVGSDLQGALVAVSDETTDRYQREFHGPIFRSRSQLPVTSGTPAPLIYDFRFDGRLWGEAEGRAVTLALYETAGENLVSEEKVREMVRYLRPASGVIFLIDPLQIDAVREALPPTANLPVLDPQANPQDMITRVLTKLEDGKVLERNALLSIPVAVVLTKCDVLRDAGMIDLTRAWAGNRRHIGYFNRGLHDDMSGSMEEYVKRWSPAVYNIVTQRFSRYAFFGASATGCAPDRTGFYKYISPWRVEDPLLWLLAEVGVIPVR